ncbi:MAG: hypothetical protein QOG23_3165 [Blastocatellia bacterium]|nr:hypothetical protein [Blastocatellia bacterium]
MLNPNDDTTAMFHECIENGHLQQLDHLTRRGRSRRQVQLHVSAIAATVSHLPLDDLRFAGARSVHHLHVGCNRYEEGTRKGYFPTESNLSALS